MAMDWLRRNGVAGGGKAIAVMLCFFWLAGCAGEGGQGPHVHFSNLQRTKVFLAAGDFRRAIEACQKEVSERPSASSYVALTYVYHVLDAYVESLAKADRWVPIELLVHNLSPGRSEDLLDAPDVLPRIAKELIQQGPGSRPMLLRRWLHGSMSGPWLSFMGRTKGLASAAPGAMVVWGA